MIFAKPVYLLLFIVIGLIYFLKKKRPQILAIQYPDAGALAQLEDKKTRIFSKLATIIRYLILGLIILTLAQPRALNISKKTHQEGIDILLILDVSISMNAEDLEPNRAIVAKNTIEKFIKQRKTDRIGLVIFGGEAFTKCPLTIDYEILNKSLKDSEVGIAGNGTAIGVAITTGLNRLKHSKAQSKIIILLTDGENNAGSVDPLTAAKLAQKLKVKVYTIGVGKEGGAAIPIYHPSFGKRYARDPNTGRRLLTKLDEESLKEIAAITNAEYFRAIDKDTLEKIYEYINDLEKSKIDTTQFMNYKEFFPVLLWFVFILLLVEGLLVNLILVVVP